MVSPVFNKDPQAVMMHHRAHHDYANALIDQLGDYSVPQNQQAQGDPWPWPVGVKEVALEHNALVQRFREKAGAEPKPEAQHFDTEAHRAFMRGLG